MFVLFLISDSELSCCTGSIQWDKGKRLLVSDNLMYMALREWRDCI